MPLNYDDNGEVVGVDMEKLRNLKQTIEINHNGKTFYFISVGAKFLDSENNATVDDSGNSIPIW